MNQKKSCYFKSGSAGQGDDVTILPVIYLKQAATAVKELLWPVLMSCHLTVS